MAEALFLAPAEDDYREARDWYHARSPQAAAGFEAAVEVALRKIVESPRLWPLCGARHRTYQLRRYPYHLVYREEADTILIVAVAHASRSDRFWKGRD